MAFVTEEVNSPPLTVEEPRKETNREDIWGPFPPIDDYVAEVLSSEDPDDEETVASPRKLLIDDGLNEDKAFQKLPDEESLLLWRLKDLSLIDELDPAAFSDGADEGGLGVSADPEKTRLSNVSLHSLAW